MLRVQRKKKGKLWNTCVLVFVLVVFVTIWFVQSVSRNPVSDFPRILHQMHKSAASLSALETRLSSECKTLNVQFNWEYRFWNDTEVAAFVQMTFPEVYEWWHSMEPEIKRIDTSRYLILHAFGGAYADVDVECINPLELLVRDLPRGTAWFGGCVSMNVGFLCSNVCPLGIRSPCSSLRQVFTTTFGSSTSKGYGIH